MVALNNSRVCDSQDMKNALDCLKVGTRKSGNGVRKWDNAPLAFRMPDRDCPTSAPPGTVEKLKVMGIRHDRGEEIFHPFDARYDTDPRPLKWYIARYEEQERNRLVGV